jgi:hypothetical protein
MKANHESDHRVAAGFGHHYKQPGRWLALLLPFLRHVSMRTLALLMFVGFAVLNTTHGKDTETKEPVFAGTNKIEIVDNSHNEAAHVAAEPTGHTISASSILWQFLSNIVNGFAQALNDAALIEYAKEQGLDTSDSLTAPCPDASGQSPSSFEQPPTQSSKPSAD